MSQRALAILQARASSSRLPGKVLKPLSGAPMLARQIERIRRSTRVDQLILATSRDASDDAVETVGRQIGIAVYRGELDDVLDRFYQAARSAPERPELVVRLTGDCPLTDWTVIDAAIDQCRAERLDYLITDDRHPDGLDVEVMTMAALETAWREARLGSDREHVTPFIRRETTRFKTGRLAAARDLSTLRWTVDEPADFEMVSRVYAALYPRDPAFKTDDILAYLATRPEVSQLNAGLIRNEGYARSLQKDALAAIPPKTAVSADLRERAYRTWIRAEDWWFDVHNRIRTRGVIEVAELRTTSEFKPHAVAYQGVWGRNVRKLVAEARLRQPELREFVDIGCGLGRACFVASRAGFARVRGIDFDADLVEGARANLRRFRGRGADFEFDVADAAEARLRLKPPTLLFMFNPFDGVVMKRFVDHHRDELARSRSLIAYARDVERSTLQAAGLRQVWRDNERMLSLWSS